MTQSDNFITNNFTLAIWVKKISKYTMVVPSRRNRILIREEDESIEQFTDISNAVYETNENDFSSDKNIIQDFEKMYTAWFEAFSAEYKSMTSQMTFNFLLWGLPLLFIFRTLIAAVMTLCLLETFMKFSKSCTLLGTHPYLIIMGMNLIFNIDIIYYSILNEYISGVNKFLQSVSAMFQLFKIRLNILRRKYDWNIKLPCILDVGSEYSIDNISYASLIFSAFYQFNICGIGVGIMIFQICQYFKFPIFPFLDIFIKSPIFEIFIILATVSIIKFIEIHIIFRNLKKSIKRLKQTTTRFLTWFENDCEIYKILEKYESKYCTSDLFPLKSLKLYRKARLLNFAIVIIACECFANLNITRKQFKNVLLFLVYERYSALLKLTESPINTKEAEKLSKQNIVKKKYPLSRPFALCTNTEVNRTDKESKSASLNKKFFHFSKNDTKAANKSTDKEFESIDKNKNNKKPIKSTSENSNAREKDARHEDTDEVPLFNENKAFLNQDAERNNEIENSHFFNRKKPYADENEEQRIQDNVFKKTICDYIAGNETKSNCNLEESDKILNFGNKNSYYTESMPDAELEVLTLESPIDYTTENETKSNYEVEDTDKIPNFGNSTLLYSKHVSDAELEGLAPESSIDNMTKNETKLNRELEDADKMPNFENKNSYDSENMSDVELKDLILESSLEWNYTDFRPMDYSECTNLFEKDTPKKENTEIYKTEKHYSSCISQQYACQY